MNQKPFFIGSHHKSARLPSSGLSMPLCGKYHTHSVGTTASGTISCRNRFHSDGSRKSIVTLSVRKLNQPLMKKNSGMCVSPMTVMSHA